MAKKKKEPLKQPENVPNPKIVSANFGTACLTVLYYEDEKRIAGQVDENGEVYVFSTHAEVV
jgi:hypothetical protein